MRWWAELIGAAALLTRLPVGGWVRIHPPSQDCVWAYPCVGAVVGLGGAATAAAGLALGLAQPLAVLWALAATMLITGGLHEDGLADTADGLGGGRTTERKLAIMRDSRIGSFGALALLASFALRGTALAVLPHPLRALVLAGILGRGAMLLPLLLLRPARAEGLAHGLRGSGRGALFAGLAIAALAAGWAPLAGLAAAGAGLAVAVVSWRQIGGYTGDTLGAAELAAECGVLSVLSV